MAESLIDGITYGKGCSMIKQLIFLLDWDTFCAGLKIYFKRHRWGNTTLQDFIRCIQIGYDEAKPLEPLDLNRWSESWLQTKGVNKIMIDPEKEGNTIKKFKIKQAYGPCGDNRWRKQKINITFYNAECGVIEKFENIEIKD